jgi:hypothetical protein
VSEGLYDFLGNDKGVCQGCSGSSHRRNTFCFPDSQTKVRLINTEPNDDDTNFPYVTLHMLLIEFGAEIRIGIIMVYKIGDHADFQGVRTDCLLRNNR